LKSGERLAAGVLQVLLGQGSRIHYSQNNAGPLLNQAIGQAVGDAQYDVSTFQSFSNFLTTVVKTITNRQLNGSK